MLSGFTMQVTQTAVDGLKHEFKVVLSAKDIEAKIDHRLSELGREVRVPGFRPGKVPLAVLKKRYGDAVVGEVVQRAVSDSSAQAIMDQGLRPALQPKIEITAFAKGNDLEYKLAVEVLPQVEPIDLTKIKLERLVAEVTDKEVEESLERLAAQTKRTEPALAGHKAAKGDVLVIDYKGSIGGEAFPGGEAEG
ncbi:MAG TPA: trigger factor, partial [Steroidobacteraceae bacterium]|nr:trigger factor [Steroidobacteraceae bacterium]